MRLFLTGSIFALLLAAGTSAQAPWSGQWVGEVPVPTVGRVTMTVYLAEGNAYDVEGLVVVDDSSAPVTGTVGQDGELELTVHSPGKPGAASLRLEDGELAGTVKPPGLPLSIRVEGQRVGPVPSGVPLGVHIVPNDVDRPRAVGSQSVDDLTAEVTDRLIDKLMDRQRVVGLAVAIAIDGEVSDVRCYGYADHRTRTPVRPTTMFRWASISKPLSAAMTFALLERGKVDLQADVRELVPEFPEKAHTVTLQHILCHQSGITHYAGAVRTRRDYAEPHPFCDKILALDMFKDTPLRFEPGTKYSYSTHAWTLLAATLERAADRPFEELLQELVAKPAGMTSVRPDFVWEEIPRRARGYHRSGTNLVQSPGDDISWKLAGGGLISTAEDLAKFGAGLVNGTLLEPDTLTTMTTEQKTRDGKGTGCGLGIRVRVEDGETTWSHTGSQNQTATILLLCPKRQIAVAIMCNTYRTNLRIVGQELLTFLRDYVDER